MERVEVAVVGGGQAGLATAKALADRGIGSVVLERNRIASTWRSRWDSFCLVTPNWSIDLPDGRYTGGDPDGFMPRDDIAAFFDDYASRHGLEVREHTEVTALSTNGDGGFEVTTSNGRLKASVVVASSGAYQRPHVPAAAASLPAGLPRFDITQYREPGSLPDGDVLIVGSGQTGCQLTEELMEAGREVVVSCGKAPWSPRRFGDRDTVWWGVETGFLDQPAEMLPAPEARFAANILATGHGGGHDLHLRTLQAAGVTLVGHLTGADGDTILFADDLAESVAWGDDRYRDFAVLVRKTCEERGLPFPEDLGEPPPFEASAPTSLPAERFGSVLFTGGFRPNYGSWIPWGEAFDAMGFPLQRDGASTAVNGLFFMGVHFMRKRKSAILNGAREDAEVVAGKVAEHLGA